MEALKAIGVSRKYGAQEVLKALDLTVEAGAFEALMGPSGCGKSTFLHLAAGLLAADAGTILIGGTDVTRMSDAAVTTHSSSDNFVAAFSVATNAIIGGPCMTRPPGR